MDISQQYDYVHFISTLVSSIAGLLAMSWIIYRVIRVICKPTDHLVKLLGIGIPAPPLLTLAGLKADGCVIRWRPAEEAIPLSLKFKLYVNGVGLGEIKPQNGTILVSGLRPDHGYIVRILASNSGEFTARSEPINICTLPAASSEFYSSDRSTNVTVSSFKIEPVPALPASASSSNRDRSASISQKQKLAQRRQVPPLIQEEPAEEPAESVLELTQVLDNLRKEKREADEQMETELKEFNQRHALLTAELDDVQQQLADKSSISKELQKQVSIRLNEETQIKKRKAAVETKLNNTIAEREKIKADIKRWESEAPDIEAQITENMLKQEIITNDAHRKVDLIKAEISKETERRLEIEEKIRQIVAEIQELEEENKALEAETEDILSQAAEGEAQAHKILNDKEAEHQMVQQYNQLRAHNAELEHKQTLYRPPDVHAHAQLSIAHATQSTIPQSPTYAYDMAHQFASHAQQQGAHIASHPLQTTQSPGLPNVQANSHSLHQMRHIVAPGGHRQSPPLNQSRQALNPTQVPTSHPQTHPGFGALSQLSAQPSEQIRSIPQSLISHLGLTANQTQTQSQPQMQQQPQPATQNQNQKPLQSLQPSTPFHSMLQLQSQPHFSSFSQSPSPLAMQAAKSESPSPRLSQYRRRAPSLGTSRSPLDAVLGHETKRSVGEVGSHVGYGFPSHSDFLEKRPGSNTVGSSSNLSIAVNLLPSGLLGDEMDTNSSLLRDSQQLPGLGYHGRYDSAMPTSLPSLSPHGLSSPGEINNNNNNSSSSVIGGISDADRRSAMRGGSGSKFASLFNVRRDNKRMSDQGQSLGHTDIAAALGRLGSQAVVQDPIGRRRGSFSEGSVPGLLDKGNKSGRAYFGSDLID